MSRLIFTEAEFIKKNNLSNPKSYIHGLHNTLLKSFRHLEQLCRNNCVNFTFEI